MKTNLFQKVMELICAAILLVSVLPAGSAQAIEKPGTPSITVKAVNGTDVKVTIGKTSGADGYEVWVTSDCGYTGYRYSSNWDPSSDERVRRDYYNYSRDPGDYIFAAKVEKDGSAVRTVTIKNLSISNVSIKVRGCDRYNDAGDFSEVKSVKVIPQKKGYKDSYDFSETKKGDIIKFGTYQQDFPVNGKDPIEWVVLDKTENGIFVMSKYILDCVPYTSSEYSKYNENSSKSKTWEDSGLRSWLNKKFYKAAFNKTEKAMIKKTKVRTSEISPDWVVYYCDTKDKLFCLSVYDVIQEKYGFNPNYSVRDINRRCAATLYAQGQGAEQGTVVNDTGKTAENKKSFKWWLRGQGISGLDHRGIACIHCSGHGWDARESDVICDTYPIKVRGKLQSEEGFGVRPAMWIKLKSE